MPMWSLDPARVLQWVPPANFNFEGKKCRRVVTVWWGQLGLDVPLHASNTTEHQQGTGPQGL